MNATIYFGTVLLEANRWTAEKQPGYRVGDWLGRLAAAGFDGIELWQNHALLATASEREALRSSQLPVTVFNSYVALDAGGDEHRRCVAELVRRLGSLAVKFNVGNDVERVRDDLRVVTEWGATMPGVQLLCECHPGTALEDPVLAAKALAAFPAIGVIVHPFTCHDLAAWTKNLGDRIVHCHVQMLDNGRQVCGLRDRPDRVRQRLGLLRECGYAGSFTLEFVAGVGVPPENRDALFAAACDDLAFLREAW